MGIDNFAFLAFFPPIYRLNFVPTLSLEEVFHYKLLVFVPSHFQGFFIDIDQVINLFVINLEKRDINFKAESCALSLFIVNSLEKIFYTSGN